MDNENSKEKTYYNQIFLVYWYFPGLKNNLRGRWNEHLWASAVSQANSESFTSFNSLINPYIQTIKLKQRDWMISSSCWPAPGLLLLALPASQRPIALALVLMFPHVSCSFFFIIIRHISFTVLNFDYWSPFPSPYACLLAFLTIHSLT